MRRLRWLTMLSLNNLNALGGVVLIMLTAFAFMWLIDLIIWITS